MYMSKGIAYNSFLKSYGLAICLVIITFVREHTLHECFIFLQFQYYTIY